jgi:maintenance of morphology protein 1
MKIYFQEPDSYMTLSLSKDTEMEFHVRSVLGGKTKIKDLPKLSQMIISKLKTELAQKWIDQEIKRPIPSFWRRKK